MNKQTKIWIETCIKRWGCYECCNISTLEEKNQVEIATNLQSVVYQNSLTPTFHSHLSNLYILAWPQIALFQMLIQLCVGFVLMMTNLSTYKIMKKGTELREGRFWWDEECWTSRMTPITSLSNVSLLNSLVCGVEEFED